MKHRIFLVLVAVNSVFTAFASKDIELPPKSVVLFTQSALIESETDVALTPGVSVLKFINLSPYILKESIRIEGDGSCKIINVQHQNDFLNELEKRQELLELQLQMEALNSKIVDEQTQVKIIDDKYNFLKANSDLTGKEQGINPDQFGTLIDIYGKNIEMLNLEKLKRERLIKAYKNEQEKLNNQINLISLKPEMPSGTITVTVNAGKAQNSHIKIAYLIDHVSWYPSYDIRYNGADKPVSLICKANITQNTGIDWRNVKIILSTAKTNLSAQIPDFRPWYLRYYYPEVSEALQGKVAGLAMSAGAPGAGDHMSVRGISNVTADAPMYIVDGVVQPNIGYLQPDEIQDMEVINDASSNAIYGAQASNGVVKITTRKEKNYSGIPLTITWKQETSNEYEIEAAQTLLSGSGLTTIQYKEAELMADYEYQSIPSLSANVFLIAKVPEWYKADILDGEANLYMENAYVGKTNLVKKQFTDTMEISFGIDNHIDIKREKVYGFSQSQIMGSNRKETRIYKITIRNNKSYAVTSQITDQIPVSTSRDIQVEPLELSSGNLTKNNGKVAWRINLKPFETTELLLKYEVKYPKDQILEIN